MLTTKTSASTSAIQGRVGRCPTNSAMIEIVIATAQGQRCSTHNSHGTSPPQYCEESAAPSTAALAISTKPAKTRVDTIMRV
jgi:hypothetical protein